MTDTKFVTQRSVLREISTSTKEFWDDKASEALLHAARQQRFKILFSSSHFLPLENCCYVSFLWLNAWFVVCCSFKTGVVCLSFASFILGIVVLSFPLSSSSTFLRFPVVSPTRTFIQAVVFSAACQIGSCIKDLSPLRLLWFILNLSVCSSVFFSQILFREFVVKVETCSGPGNRSPVVYHYMTGDKSNGS